MRNIFSICFTDAARRIVMGCSLVALSTTLVQSAEVIVVGDTRLKPVHEIIAGIRETITVPFEVYDSSQVRGTLPRIVARERATVVVALGRDAIDESALVPPSVAVVYDLVIKPPVITRPNTTGFYMATPVREYLEVVDKYFPALKRIAVVGSPQLMKVVNGSRHSQVKSLSVGDPYELVDAVARYDDVDAVLLLPDVSLLTKTAVDAIYLQSFKKKIPLLGVSERHVRQGALFALVFDATRVGRQIGETASEAARGADMGLIPASPARDFDLFLNLDTAKRMGIDIPRELIQKAKKVFP